MLPGAGDRGQAAHGMQRRGAVAAARKSVAATDIRPLGGAVEAGELLDFPHRQPGDRGRPFRRARRKMRFEPRRIVGVARHVIPIGKPVAERHVHHRAGQRAVAAGAQHQVRVRHLRGAVAIRIHNHEFRPPRLASASNVGHDVDLGGHGVAAPHHDQVALRHFARIRAGDAANSGLPARLADHRADGGALARVAHRMPQPVDAVALHQTHRAGVVIGPDRLRAVPRRGLDKSVGDAVQRLVPADRAKLSGAFRTGAQQRVQHAIRVMHPLGVTRNLGADHACGVAVVLRTAHGADAVRPQYLDLQRAGGRAVVRAGAGSDVRHGKTLAQFCPGLPPAQRRCNTRGHAASL